jgi:hypothetical protein
MGQRKNYRHIAPAPESCPPSVKLAPQPPHRYRSPYLPSHITSRRERQLRDDGAVIEPDRDRFLDAARRLAAADGNGLADPEGLATELGIGLHE